MSAVFQVHVKQPIYAMRWQGDLAELLHFPVQPDYCYVEEDGMLVVQQRHVLDARVRLDDYLMLGTTGRFFEVLKDDFDTHYVSVDKLKAMIDSRAFLSNNDFKA